MLTKGTLLHVIGVSQLLISTKKGSCYVRPKHYEVHLTVDLEKFTFAGVIGVELDVLKDTKSAILKSTYSSQHTRFLGENLQCQVSAPETGSYSCSDRDPWNGKLGISHCEWL